MSIVVLVGLPALTACAPETPNIGVEWSVPLQQMGLLSVDPPQEDVRVGDMYLYAHNPDASVTGGDIRQSWIGNRGRWTSLPVRDDLNAEFSARPSFPPTPRRSDSQTWTEPSETDAETVFAPDRTPRRLRVVQLQGITATFAGRESVSSLIPSEAINLAAGIAWDDYKVLTVSAGAGEGYALSLDNVIDLLVDAPGDGVAEYRLKAPYRRHIDLAAVDAGSSVWIRVLSEVVYVRTIDIAVQSAKPPDVVEDVPPPDVTSVRAPRKARDPDAPDRAIQPFDRAARINELLDEMGNGMTPTGAIRAISVTDKSVTMRRIWPRALAIAARGLTLEIEPSTGRILSLHPMGVASSRKTPAAPPAATPESVSVDPAPPGL